MRHVGIVGKKLLRLLLGFFVLALASAVIKQANIGLGPWDALHDGISVQTPLTYGQASMAAGLVIVVIDFLCKERLGFGTLLNIFVIGALVDVILMSGLVPKLDGSLLPGCLYGLVGMVLMGVAVAIAWSRVYLGVHWPLDMVGGFLVGLMGCVSAAILWSLFGPALYRGLSQAYRVLFALPIRKGWIRD